MRRNLRRRGVPLVAVRVVLLVRALLRAAFATLALRSAASRPPRRTQPPRRMINARSRVIITTRRTRLLSGLAAALRLRLRTAAAARALALLQRLRHVHGLAVVMRLLSQRCLVLLVRLLARKRRSLAALLLAAERRGHGGRIGGGVQMRRHQGCAESAFAVVTSAPRRRSAPRRFAHWRVAMGASSSRALSAGACAAPRSRRLTASASR